ncbi:ABC transporter substrate-binding protein [Pokkaliibacter sp. CJK22405]|uniref:ABC transporter substrate-binding protein n=1 Tax=Pokkaliibacter sp. CJK22405 TaxID=3384615 RepID=UPI003985053C
MNTPTRSMLAQPVLRKLLPWIGGAMMALSLGVQAATHEVATKYGTLRIEGEPSRVVTLYEGALDTATALGVKAVGAVATRGGDSVASYIASQVPDISIVGTARETNIEAVAALKPDLILAPVTLSKEQYQLLSSIAPTVVPDVQRFAKEGWKAEARVFAQAMGREAELDSRLKTLDQEVAAVKAQFTQEFTDDERKTTLIRWMPQGAMVMGSQLFSSSLLEQMGFAVSDAGLVKEGRPHSSSLSQEKLSMIDGDWLFLATLNKEGRDALATAEKSPAFARLNVVKEDRVIPVDGQIWTSATGPLAAEQIVDTVRKAITKKAQESAS